MVVEGWVVMVVVVVVAMVVMVLVVVVLGRVLGQGQVLGRVQAQEVGWALVATLLPAWDQIQSPPGSRRGPPHSQSLQQQRRHGSNASSAQGEWKLLCTYKVQAIRIPSKCALCSLLLDSIASQSIAIRQELGRQQVTEMGLRGGALACIYVLLGALSSLALTSDVAQLDEAPIEPREVLDVH